MSVARHKSILSNTRKLSVAFVLGASALTAMAVGNKPVSKSPLSAVKRVRQWLQTGRASWYGRALQGHRTATGEKYDMHALTCAHRTLPLGSWIRVTNLSNRKSIFVRVNDRGPVADDRIIDLSFAAAQAVGIDGVSKVKLESVNSRDPEMQRALVAQVAGFAFAMPLPGR